MTNWSRFRAEAITPDIVEIACPLHLAAQPSDDALLAEDLQSLAVARNQGLLLRARPSFDLLLACSGAVE